MLCHGNLNGKEPRVSQFFLVVMTLVNGRDLIHSSSKAQSTVETQTVSQLQSCPLMRSIYMWRIVFFLPEAWTLTSVT